MTERDKGFIDFINARIEPCRLTPTERVLAVRLARYGVTNKDIAHEMGITADTTKVYAARLYQKLRLRNGRLELMALEIERLECVVACLRAAVEQPAA